MQIQNNSCPSDASAGTNWQMENHTYPTPYPFQLAGAGFLADSAPVALLADEMGVGKTAQAIWGADIISARRILFLCPSIARINTKREFEKFQRMHRSVVVIKNGKDFSKLDEADVVIVSYDLAARNPDKLDGLEWDAVILDEAHYLKNPEAKRTKVIYGQKCNNDGIIRNAKRVFLLTGTPAPNNPAELYTHAHAFWPYAIPMANADYWDFADTYSYVIQLPNGGVKISGARNLDKLREALSPFVLRRTKAEVLPDMPEMRLATYTLEANHIPKEVHDLEKSESLKNIGVMLSDVAASEISNRTQVSGQLAEWRRLTEIAKVPLVVELLKEELGMNKIVIFHHHREAGDMLMEGLEEFNPVRITGGQTPTSRQAAIDAFQTDPNTRVVVASIQAASTAITLTAASDAVFLSADWNPANNAQAMQRIHRIGQNKSVLIRFFALAGSVDELVQKTLLQKTEAISELFHQTVYKETEHGYRPGLERALRESRRVGFTTNPPAIAPHTRTSELGAQSLRAG